MVFISGIKWGCYRLDLCQQTVQLENCTSQVCISCMVVSDGNGPEGQTKMSAMASDKEMNGDIL